MLGSPFKPMSVDEWLAFTQSHKGLNHYPSVGQRFGSMLLSSAVEFHLFPPRTPLNDNFHVNVVMWEDMPWGVFSVPAESHADIVKTGRALAMQVNEYPPAMMFFGLSAMALTVPPKMSERELKRLLTLQGFPKELLDGFKGLRSFPGDVETIHSIENRSELLTKPIRPDEMAGMKRREQAMIATMAQGVTPPLKDIADYVYGPGRVLAFH